MSLPYASIDDDLFHPNAIDDPYPVLAALRERAPVHRSERLGGWIVTRYEDVQRAFRDPRLSSDRIGPWYFGRLTEQQQEELSPTFRILSRWMVFTDPPVHTRLRGLVQRAFTPRMIEGLRGRIEEIVDSHVAALPTDREVDLIQHLAYPLPAIVIAEMLGVPSEDRDRFKHWSDEVTALVFGELGDENRHMRAQNALEELGDYIDQLIDSREVTSGEDLLTALLHAHESGDALDREEVIATCVLLLFGGHETTTNLLANSVRSLLLNPEQLDLLRQEPSLTSGAVEELLRFDGPVKALVRNVAEPMEFDGHQFEPNERVFLMQAAANRDPAKFDDPNSLDIRRPNASANLGFGYGLHYCLGAPLARLETQIALRRLFEARPGLELADDAPVWNPVLISRAMDRLMVRA